MALEIHSIWKVPLSLFTVFLFEFLFVICRSDKRLYMSVLQQQLQSDFFVFFRQYTNESKTSAVDLEIKSLREMTPI